MPTTASDILQWLPPISACKISKDNVWHNRWRVTYPRDAKGTNRVFGALRSEKAAIKELIEWAWAQHAAAGGDNCPFELSAWD